MRPTLILACGGATVLAALALGSARSTSQTDPRADSRRVRMLEAPLHALERGGVPISGGDDRVTCLTLDLSKVKGAAAGLDLRVVGFRILGRMASRTTEAPAGGTGDRKEAGSDVKTGGQAIGDLVLHGIIAERADLKQTDLLRLLRHDQARARRESEAAASHGGEGEPREGAGEAPQAAPAEAGAIGVPIFHYTIPASQLERRELSFEVIGVAPAGQGADREALEDVRRELDRIETTAPAPGARDAGVARALEQTARESLQQSEPRARDVTRMLNVIEKGQAHLYLEILPAAQLAQTKDGDAGEAPASLPAPAAAFVLTEIAIVFAAVPNVGK